jgi:methenyltetrahydromethanopterin cyclohydrolase
VTLERTDYEDADIAWVCARKKAYPDEKFAKRVASRMREDKGADVVAYACTRCGRFHIGRAPARG